MLFAPSGIVVQRPASGAKPECARCGAALDRLRRGRAEGTLCRVCATRSANAFALAAASNRRSYAK